ncbi:hypothetical protein AVEN_208694-1 [Araneus ventricosus]|uniref:Uncharacterized protein n=1 Tax=Araneus ventricosus TaxID=182803 RepID=A0A4Y2FKH7_ARAVE|nr:hypothetical protein AVEN_208694-1 [Araneus ventricosus]
MRSRRIIKRGLASLVGTIMVGLLPVQARASYGRGRAVAGDSHLDSRPQHSSYCHSDAPDGFEPGRCDLDMTNLRSRLRFSPSLQHIPPPYKFDQNYSSCIDKLLNTGLFWVLGTMGGEDV